MFTVALEMEQLEKQKKSYILNPVIGVCILFLLLTKFFHHFYCNIFSFFQFPYVWNGDFLIEFPVAPPHTPSYLCIRLNSIGYRIPFDDNGLILGLWHTNIKVYLSLVILVNLSLKILHLDFYTGKFYLNHYFERLMTETEF